MNKPAVMLLLALAPMVLAQTAPTKAPTAQPAYVHVSMCGFAFRMERVNPKYVSLEAEFVNASPHGVVLLDHRCPGRGLQIDFAETGLDASATMMEHRYFLMARATGTFRGVLSRDRLNGRLGLTVQSVLNLQPRYMYPDINDGPGPVRLPEPQWPAWPPAS